MKKTVVIFIACVLLLFLAYNYKNRYVSGINFVAEHQLRHQKVIRKIPDDLTFAGENIHFKSAEAYQNYYRELRVNTTSNSSTRLLIKNAALWLPLIENTLIANGIPVDFKYIAIAESNLNNNLVSHKGAAGLWQFTESTATDYGLEVNEEVDERYNFIKSTKAACRYFRQAHKEFGTWTSAAASYNRGIGGLQKAFKNQSVNSYYDLALNRETARYIYKILALKDLICAPKKYGMPVLYRTKAPLKSIQVDTTIQDLQQFAKTMNIDYALLKEYNPWILKNSLTIKNKKSVYVIIIPGVIRTIPPEIADTNRARLPDGFTRNKNYFKNKLAKIYNS